MGCPSSVYLENNLVFSVCTHDPDTGVLTDADTVPSYRVYEDETTVAILTGSMAKLDDANTSGFYTEQIACTAANGFEVGKSYTIYIEATVDSDTGGISYGFTIEDKTGFALSAAGIDALYVRQLTEAYAADGTAPTVAQALLLIQQSLHEFAIAGTTRTVKKLDGATTAATFTLDDGTDPTSTTRAS